MFAYKAFTSTVTKKNEFSGIFKIGYFVYKIFDILNIWWIFSYLRLKVMVNKAWNFKEVTVDWVDKRYPLDYFSDVFWV